MDTPSAVILSIYGFGFLILGVLLVYLIFRRRRVKKTEDFEKRDN